MATATVFTQSNINSAMQTFYQTPKVAPSTINQTVNQIDKFRPSSTFREGVLLSKVNDFQKCTPYKLSMYDKLLYHEAVN